MRHARVLAVSAIAAGLLAAVAIAQTSTPVPLPDNEPVRTQPLEIDLSKTTWGDPKAGQTKAAACVACHGMDGNALVDMYPSIAGQSERYVAQQMALIASGQRGGLAVAMVPFVQDLSAQDMRDIGAFYATQKAGAGIADDSPVTDGPYAGMRFFEIGQQLYRRGDATRHIPACMSCHGPTGAGNPGPAYPHIGGQHAGYLARRLDEYKAGVTQETDKAHFQIMASVAANLSEQEIQALASYLQGLHDRADDVAVAPGQPAPAAAP